MPARLLVILGAGASHDCASRKVEVHEELRPPLVTGLFDPKPSFARILHRYPLAEQAAADIRPALAGGSVAVESFLRNVLRDSEHAHHRRQFWAVPLYLQDLLFETSMWDSREGRGFTQHPDSYDRLVNAALRVDEVTFVTLNYDDLFDRRLFIHGPRRSIEDYLAPSEKWALIKLHGSINWGRKVEANPHFPAATDPYLTQTFADIVAETGAGPSVSKTIYLRDQVDIGAVRFDSDIGALYYPALSAPLGPEDEVVCPNDHVDYLREKTGHHEPLHVLVIGYSGLDNNVLEHLSWGGRSIRSLAVVSESEKGASDALSRIQSKIHVENNAIALYSDGFTAFARDDVERYITDVEQLSKKSDA